MGSILPDGFTMTRCGRYPDNFIGMIQLTLAPTLVRHS